MYFSSHRTIKFSMILAAVVLMAGCASTGGKSDNAAVKVTQTTKGALITSDERILFDSGKSDIKPDGKTFITRVAKILNERTKANVVIEGHTDNVGSESSNMELSIDRANAVKAGLVQNGVDGKRLATKGYGMTHPVADNSTAEGRQANRRTEILVIGENVDNIGGASLGERLSEGLVNFFKHPIDSIKGAFSSDADKAAK